MKNGKTVAQPVPARTIERLVTYRTFLADLNARGKTQVFSNELAELVGNTAGQVRRDLMAVGCTGNTRSGYRIDDLLTAIRKLLDPPDGITLAIAGVGNLGRALLGYFALMHPRFRVVCAFDNDPNKIGRLIAGCRIHDTHRLADQLAQTPVQLGIITVPAEQAQRTADAFVQAGVRGIVNFAPSPVHVPPGVCLDGMHITATLEKVAFFARTSNRGETV